MSIRQLAAERPSSAAFACAGLQFLITVCILKAGLAYAPQSFGAFKLAAFASTVVLPLMLVQGLGLWRDMGLELSRVRPAPVFLASLVTAAMFLSMGVADKGGVGEAVLVQFVNAFGEELLFRGVVFALLLRLPIGWAIIANGILFGSMHLIHGFMDGNWHSAMWQVVPTSIAGMMFTAVRYRTGSLWLAILLHMILNLAMLYSNIEAAAGPAMLYIVQRLANVFEIAMTGYVVFNKS